MRDIIAIFILGVAALFGFLSWLSFIAGKSEEHIYPDIYEAESRRAWATDVKEKLRSLRQRKSRPISYAHKRHA